MAKRERYISGNVDLTLLVSPMEAQQLQAQVPGGRLVAAPPAMDLPDLQSIERKRQDGVMKLLFVGDMRTSANSGAVRLILRRLMPQTPCC